MVANKFLTKQTISLVGTQWLRKGLTTIARGVREIPDDGQVRYEATVFGQVVTVRRRGTFWVIVP